MLQPRHSLGRKKLLGCATQDAEPVFDGKHRVADLCALVLEQLKDSSNKSSSWALTAAQYKPLLHRAAREQTASRRREVERFFDLHPRARLVIDRLDATSYLDFADLEMHLVREISVGLFDVDTDLVHLLALLHQATLFRVQKRYRFKARQRSAPSGFELTDKPQGKTLLVKRSVWTDKKGVGFSSDFKNLGRFTLHRHSYGHNTDARHQRTTFKLTKKVACSGFNNDNDNLGSNVVSKALLPTRSNTNTDLRKAHNSKASNLLQVHGSKAGFIRNRNTTAASLKRDILEDMTVFNEARCDSQRQADRDRAESIRKYRRYLVQKIHRGLSKQAALPVDQVLALLPEIEAHVRKTIRAVPDSNGIHRNDRQQTSSKDVYAFAKSKARELLRNVVVD